MQTGSKFSLIFPIVSGQTARTFRALELVGGETFVHRALRSFVPYRDRIEKVYFIYLSEEQTRFDVAVRLGFEVHDLPFETVRLAEPTAGPAETVARGVLQRKIDGPAIVCDVDHRLDIGPLLQSLDLGTASDATRVSVWPLAGEDLKRWSVACVSKNGRIVEVAEKRLPEGSGDFLGVIGCYHFPDIRSVAKICTNDGLTRFSQYFTAQAGAGHPAIAIRLQEAEFFGDDERIKVLESGNKNFTATIFCDIDGTIFEHEDVPSYVRAPRVLPGSREKLKSWVDDGYFVILCTARARSDEPALLDALSQLEIPFHRLICGLPSGPRVVINDRKPSAMFISQALSLEISRNEGIRDIDLPKGPHVSVLKRFEGGSFAETLLIESGGRQAVRKRAMKHKNLSVGSARLKNQYRTLERFATMCPDIIPGLLGDQENSHEYFYDMEYLSGYEQLSELDVGDCVGAIDRLFEQLNKHVYTHQSRHPQLSEDWFFRHLEEKIYAKMDALAENKALRPLVVGDGVVIDGQHFPSLEMLMSEAAKPQTLRYLQPQFLSLVHGDMTFQNIMVAGDGSVKAIDMESTGSLDAVELDLGKFFQSIHSQYERWFRRSDPLCSVGQDGAITLGFSPSAPNADLLSAVRKHWSQIMNCSDDLVDLKGQFYLGLHLVRMVPFRLKVSEDQALYALSTGLQRLGSALKAISQS